jgi:phage FluMu protein Com
MKKEFNESGYSQEEMYFMKMNQELIEKRRKELDSQKLKEQDKSQQDWWLSCPKCNSKMKEVNLSGILLDQCPDCHGIYFDAGELETLTQANESKSFLGAIKKLF